MTSPEPLAITKEELTAMIKKAADEGATKALSRIGLSDETAGHDIREIRDLLTAWRSTKRSIWQTVVVICTTAILSFIGAAVWMNIQDKVVR